VLSPSAAPSTISGALAYGITHPTANLFFFIYIEFLSPTYLDENFIKPQPPLKKAYLVVNKTVVGLNPPLIAFALAEPLGEKRLVESVLILPNVFFFNPS
jgi:hypothetical protein